MPYPYSLAIPELVERAHRKADELGFPLLPEGRLVGKPAPTTATTPMDGALLRSLAAAHPEGIIGEIGTGPGVSTAWLVSGMSATTRLISCDIDQALVSRGPFDLLFFDANAQSVLSTRRSWDRIISCLTAGGQIVMDDLAPVELWPDAWKGMTDYKREFCLANERLAGVEVRTSATTVSVIGTWIR